MTLDATEEAHVTGTTSVILAQAGSQCINSMTGIPALAGMAIGARERMNVFSAIRNNRAEHGQDARATPIPARVMDWCC